MSTRTPKQPETKLNTSPLANTTFKLPYNATCAMCGKTAQKCYCCHTCGLEQVLCNCCKTCHKPYMECVCCTECGWLKVACLCCTTCKSFKNCTCCKECKKPFGQCICCKQCGYKKCECCTKCNLHYCTCCKYCENIAADCTCCKECGQQKLKCYCGKSKPASLQAGKGTSSKPPWEKRGIEIPATPRDDDWRAVWGDKFKAIDPVRDAANYYLLEPLSHGLLNSEGFTVKPRLRDFLGGIDTGFDIRTGIVYHQHNGHNKWGNPVREVDLSEFNAMKLRAKRMLEELVSTRAEIYANYTRMAIGGELRYHRCVGREQHLPSGRFEAWNRWKTITEHVGPQVFNDAKSLFSEAKWGNSYGGKKWAEIADVMYLYESGKLPAHLFLDRVFNLQHNGGSLLTKCEWGFTHGHDLEVLKAKVLEAHAANPTKWNVLYKHASQDVKDFCEEYWAVTNNVREDLGLTKTPSIKDQVIYVCDSCLITWGEGHGKYCNQNYVTKIEHDSPADSSYAIFDKDFKLLVDNLQITIHTSRGKQHYGFHEIMSATADSDFGGACHIYLSNKINGMTIKYISKDHLEILKGQLYIDQSPLLNKYIKENIQLCQPV